MKRLTDLRFKMMAHNWRAATPLQRLENLLNNYVGPADPWRAALMAAHADLLAGRRRTSSARAWVNRILTAHDGDLPKTLAVALRELFLPPTDDRLWGGPHTPCQVCGKMGYVQGCDEHQTLSTISAAHKLIQRALSTGGAPGLALRHLPQEDWESHWLSLGPEERARAWAAIKADQKARHDKARQANGKVGGRPVGDPHKIREAKRLATQGRSQREIAKAVGVGVGTINRWLKG